MGGAVAGPAYTMAYFYHKKKDTKEYLVDQFTPVTQKFTYEVIEGTKIFDEPIFESEGQGFHKVISQDEN